MACLCKTAKRPVGLHSPAGSHRQGHLKGQVAVVLRFVFVAIAGLWAAGTAAQETVSLPIPQAREIARQAILSGDTALAVALADELLASDPDDRAALIVIAAAAARGGASADRGRAAGARAFALSKSPTEKYEAARLTALAASRDGRYTLAAFWLRRALIHAPNEQEVARTTNDAAQIRRLNPWSVNLTFSALPSNNVNGGADSDELSAPGLPTGTLSADAQALRGVRATFGARIQYRLTESEASRTTVALGFQSSRVRLDDEGRALGLSGRSFATDTVDIALRHVRVLPLGVGSGEVKVGSYDYGRADYFDFRQISLGWSVPLGERTQLQISALGEKQDYAEEFIGEVNRRAWSTRVSYELENGSTVSGSLAYGTSRADVDNFTYDDWSIRAAYIWGAPIGPVTLGVNAGIRWADYPGYAIFFPVEGGREDKSLIYGATMEFADLAYAGFSPLLIFNGNATESNVSRFTRDTFTVGLSLKSTF